MTDFIETNDVLLQKGVHLGRVLSAYVNSDYQLMIVVGFRETMINLEYCIDLNNEEHKEYLISLFELERTPFVRLHEIDFTNDFVGEECKFEIELLMAHSPNGPIGVNIITAVKEY